MFIETSYCYGVRLNLRSATLPSAGKLCKDIKSFCAESIACYDGYHYQEGRSLEISLDPESIRLVLISMHSIPFDKTGTVSSVYKTLKDLKNLSPEDFGVVRNGKEIAMKHEAGTILGTFGPRWLCSYKMEDGGVKVEYAAENDTDLVPFSFFIKNVDSVVEYSTTDHGNVWVCGVPIWHASEHRFTGERGERYYGYPNDKPIPRIN